MTFCSDHFVRELEVLPDVSVLGALPPADDVVSSFDARRVVLVHRGGSSLSEAHTVTL